MGGCTLSQGGHIMDLTTRIAPGGTSVISIELDVFLQIERKALMTRLLWTRPTMAPIRNEGRIILRLLLRR